MKTLPIYLPEFLTHLRTKGRAETTIATYRRILCRMDKELPEGLPSACSDEIRDWIWTGRRSKSAMHLYRAAVCGFFGFATDPAAPVLDYDPTRHLPGVHVRRGKPRPVDTTQLSDILTRASEPFGLWYLIAAYEGLRCVEISRLDRDDVAEDLTWIRGKGDKHRQVPTHPAVWAAAQQLPPGPVARDPDGVGPTGTVAVSQRGNRHLCALGYPEITMHRLRHWYATAVNDASGGDISVTQDLLGHESPTTTRTYVAVAPAKATAAVRALPPPPPRWPT